MTSRWSLASVSGEKSLSLSLRLPEPAASVLRFALWLAARDGHDPYELLTQAGDYLRRAKRTPACRGDGEANPGPRCRGTKSKPT